MGREGEEEEETEHVFLRVVLAKKHKNRCEGRASSNSNNTRTRRTVVGGRKGKKKKTRSGFAIEDLTTPPHSAPFPTPNHH